MSGGSRIEAQISGLAPGRARKRVFVVLQAFIDDSYEKSGPYVLGGHIATVEQWQNFTQDWEALIQRFGRIDTSGRRYFKMREMKDSGDLPAFERVITDNVMMSVSAAFDLADLARAHARVHVPGISFPPLPPFVVAWQLLLTGINSRRAMLSKILPIEEKIDFYFDDQSEKKFIISIWDDFIKERSDDERRYYGATPRFEDDKDFLSLQAADFWVWWTRRQMLDKGPARIGRLCVEKMLEIDLTEDQPARMHKEVCLRSSEEDLTETLLSWARDALKHEGINRTVYDVRFSVGE